MENTAKTTDGIPSHPLDGLQLTRLQQAVEGLNNQQLVWASGYLAGLGAVQPSIVKAANEAQGVTILYASQGGNARSVAETLAENATARGLAPRLVSAGSYRPKELAKERLLVVVISTQGEGEPPESAHELFKYLQGKRAPQLANLKYAIFGLGDSSYELFCQAARELDELLRRQGAQALLDRVDADVDFQQPSSSWQGEILQTLEKLQPSDQATIIPLQRGPATVRHDRNKPFQAELLERRRITTTDAACNVQHISLEIDPVVISYRPGDALGLFFRNDPTLVAEILALTGLPAGTSVSLDGESLSLAKGLGQAQPRW